MSDFTKEELEELSGALSYWINSNQPKSEPLIPLFVKIEAMIDNYCEHEEKETIQTFLSGTRFSNQCKKCKRIV